jgi:hypothetical protein
LTLMVLYFVKSISRFVTVSGENFQHCLSVLAVNANGWT